MKKLDEKPIRKMTQAELDQMRYIGLLLEEEEVNDSDQPLDQSLLTQNSGKPPRP